VEEIESLAMDCAENPTGDVRGLEDAREELWIWRIIEEYESFWSSRLRKRVYAERVFR
jgi:hypothetical protein